MKYLAVVGLLLTLSVPAFACPPVNGYRERSDGQGIIRLRTIAVTDTNGEARNEIEVSYVPPTQDNSDWICYQEWRAAGNKPEAAQ